MFIYLLIYITFIIFSLGQVGRVSFLNGQINFYVYEIFLAILISLFIWKYGLKPLKEGYYKFKIIFYFFFLLLISFLLNFLKFSLVENLVAFLYFLRLVFYFIYFFYLLYWLKEKKNSLIIKRGIIVFIFLTLVISILQYFFYPNLRNLFYLGWDPHFYRLFGTFFDTSVAGAIYGIIFLYLLGQKKLRWWYWEGLVFYLIFIVLTFSRSIYLALGITLFIAALFHKKIWQLVILIVLFIALVIVAPKPSGEGVNLGRIFSINSRLKSYQQATELWQKNWLIGIGYNHIRYARESLKEGNAGASFHNSFLMILVTGGVLGLIGWLGVLEKLERENPKIIWLLIFLSLVSLFDNIWLHPFILFLFFSLNPLLSR